MLKYYINKMFAILILVVSVFSIAALACYLVLWIFSFKKHNIDFGVSFSVEYAKSLGLDWKKTYSDILKDLKPRYVRITIPWKDVENIKGNYDYSEIDWLFNASKENNSKALVAIGQKIPRWPECYFPNWSTDLSADNRKQALLSYIEKTVNRYKNHPALEYWQVENEPFIKFTFGSCEGFDKDTVAEEVALVRKLDPNHKIVVTDSGELATWREAGKSGDILGVTLYRIIRKKTDTIWRYSFLPAGAYRFRAWLFGPKNNNYFISELQTEPWFNDSTPLNTSIPTQEETMDIKQMQANIEYAKYTGATRAYFWGAEWWYWMKTEKNDSRYWDIASRQI